MLPMTKCKGIISSGWSPIPPLPTKESERDFSVKIHQIFITETQRTDLCFESNEDITDIQDECGSMYQSVVVCTTVQKAGSSVWNQGARTQRVSPHNTLQGTLGKTSDQKGDSRAVASKVGKDRKIGLSRMTLNWRSPGGQSGNQVNVVLPASMLCI